MNRMVLAAVALLLLGGSTLHAQSIWRHFTRPDLGGGLYFYSIRNKDLPEAEYNTVHYGFLGGFNLPFLEIADDFTAGFNPSLGLSVAATNSYGGSSSMAVEVPLFATLKYNTDATWKGSKTPVGFSVGLGYHHTGFFFPDAGEFLSIGAPAYMLEFNFGVRRGFLTKIRWTSWLGDIEAPLSEGIDPPTLVFSQSALHLVLVPSY